MTNKEAIEYLKEVQSHIDLENGCYTQEMYDAIDMAIGKLQANAEEPFIAESRDAAIQENLPLFFIYYKETGVLDIYITETKELFEKRHCSKHLHYFELKEIATNYLDWYLDWKSEQSRADFLKLCKEEEND